MNCNTLDILRIQTRHLHKQLDSHELLSVFIAPSISKDEYIRSLNAIYKPQRELERCVLIALSKYFPDYDYRERYPCIEEDLYAMGSGLKVYNSLEFSINSKSELLGFLYVLEGSNFQKFIKLIATHDVVERELSDSAIYAFHLFIEAIDVTNADD